MKIPKRIASTVINALKGGVVPRVGLSYITVGREKEIDALLHDVEVIGDGGASFRFIVGRYGSGKSFLLQAIRNYVMDRNFVVADADLSPERRLQGSRGQGLATYRELIRNLSTKTRPEGGALTLILDRWISGILQEIQEAGVLPSSPEGRKLADGRIAQVTGLLSEMVHGYDFSRLLLAYYQAYLEEDSDRKAKAVKWLRGEYATKTEAKQELGVNGIIGDEDWYEYIKIFAVFLRQAGYRGMLVLMDELVNLYKIPNSITRQYNYEKILAMYNDMLQGKAQYLGIIMCGTPQCMEDQRRGIYSYEALRSRLAQGRFGREDAKDMLSPVMTLSPLTYEEMLVLIEKLQEIHETLYGYQSALSQEDRVVLIETEYGRMGAQSHITPREVIRDFIELLDIVYQNPQMDVKQLLESDRFVYAKTPLEERSEAGAGTEAFAEFEL